MVQLVFNSMIILLPTPPCKFCLYRYFHRDSIGSLRTSLTPAVEIFLAPVNDPPVAEDDYVFYTILRDQTVYNSMCSRTIIVVWTRRTKIILWFLILRLIMHQVFPIWVDGTFTYFPPYGFLGEDTFTYTVADQNDLQFQKYGNGAYLDCKDRRACLTGPTCGILGPIWKQGMAGFIMRDFRVVVCEESIRYYPVMPPGSGVRHIGWFWTGEKYFNWIYLDDLIGHSGKDEDRDKNGFFGRAILPKTITGSCG